MSRHFLSTVRRLRLQSLPQARPVAAPLAAARGFNSSTATPAQPALRENHEQPNVGSSGFHESARSHAEWAQFGRDHIARGLGRMKDEVVVKGEGLKLITSEGKEYLDFTAGIGVTNLGHCHPQVSAAAAEQVHNLVHMQCSIMFHPAYLQLIERLLPNMPHPSLDSFFFWNSGAEAVEAAIKLARFATGKQGIICFQGGYHGRTAGSGAVTRSKTIYTHGTGPLMPSVYATAYPYWHSLGVEQHTSEEELCRLAEHQLDMVLRQQVAPKDVAAMIIEPVQGEGGYVPCPPRFLRHLREVCNKHNILLIIDEVQSGFFRTGTYYNISQHPDVKPDVMIFAKGVANGFPISGIVSRKELADTMDVGSFGGTYAGNAVACAAGVAAQDVYATGDVERNVQERSKQLFQALHALEQNPKTKNLITEVRGVGLMVAIEFRVHNDPLTHTGLPKGTVLPKDIGKRVQQKCLDQGLLILTTSCFDTIRFIPALIVSEQEMKTAMDIFTAAVEEVAREG